MALLSGLDAGVADSDDVYPEGSFNRRVADRIKKLQRSQRQLARAARDADETDKPAESE